MVHHFRRAKGKVQGYFDTFRKKLTIIAGVVGSLSVIVGFLWTYGPQLKAMYDKKVIADAAMAKVPEQVSQLQGRVDKMDGKLDLLLKFNGVPQDAQYAKRYETRLEQ